VKRVSARNQIHLGAIQGLISLSKKQGRKHTRGRYASVWKEDTAEGLQPPPSEEERGEGGEMPWNHSTACFLKPIRRRKKVARSIEKKVTDKLLPLSGGRAGPRPRN